MAIKTVQDLLIDGLRDIYDAEKRLARALPKMARKANAPELKAAFAQHAEETRGQIERLEQCFEHLDRPKRGKACEAMQGLLTEAEEHMNEVPQPQVLDAAMIGAAQKVEHYEIASYGTLRSLATALGHAEVARLLEETLAEEKATDEKLTLLAEQGVNDEALRRAA